MPSAADLRPAADQRPVDMSSGPPRDCQELRRTNPSATTDGEYTLYIDGDPAKPWTVYCAGMPENPAEYLTLKNTGGEWNFSQYTAGGYSPGSDVRTSFQRIRIEPSTRLVNISDQLFSTSTGLLIHGGIEVRSMPYGVAMDCMGATGGKGNVDLRGTPFALVSDAFVVGGHVSSGSSQYDAGGQVVELAGGGSCGWVVSQPGVYGPFNIIGSFQLGLVYIGM